VNNERKEKKKKKKKKSFFFASFYESVAPQCAWLARTEAAAEVSS
jgi:hypothetical protein